MLYIRIVAATSRSASAINRGAIAKMRGAALREGRGGLGGREAVIRTGNFMPSRISAKGEMTIYSATKTIS